MHNYVVFLLLLIIAIGQTAWAPFLIVYSVVVPITVIYIWLISPKVKTATLSLFAFIAGLIVDLLSAQLIGTHALTLLVVVGVMWVVENHTTRNKFIARNISIVVGIGIYLYLLDTLGRLL